MEHSKADHELVAQLVREVADAVGQVGELEAWVAKHLDGSVDETAKQACVQAAEQFLVGTPPQIGAWEHLLVTLAFHSGRNREQTGLDTCKSIIEHLTGQLGGDPSRPFNTPELTTLASAMTVVLAIQDKLRQDIEESMRRMCDQFPAAVAEVAEHCQDIWKRRGQMSGRRGLFVWDVPRGEWRLARDFKPYRPIEGNH